MPTADDILKKYVEAIGGQAAIDKLKTRPPKEQSRLRRAELSFQFELPQSGDKFYFMVTTPQECFRARLRRTSWLGEEWARSRNYGRRVGHLQSRKRSFVLISLKINTHDRPESARTRSAIAMYRDGRRDRR